MTFIHIDTNKSVLSISKPIQITAPGHLDAMYATEYLSDLWLWYPHDDRVNNYIQEGQQVYITKGQRFDWENNTPPGFEEKWPEDTHGFTTPELDEYNWYITTSEKHKGEVWVLVDKTKIAEPIYTFDQISFQEVLTDKPVGWKKLLQDGDAANANLQWEQLK